MPIINKANGLVAEFAVFSVEPDTQAYLIEKVIQHIESTFKLKG
jgi:hypothetical protein